MCKGNLFGKWCHIGLHYVFFVRFCPPQRSLHERENILNNYAQCTHTTTKALHNSQQNVVLDIN